MREWIFSTLGGGATALAIIVATIGLAGALGGALSTYFVARKNVYINSITSERMKWVTLLRTNIALLIGHMTIIQTAKIDRKIISDQKLTETFFAMNQIAKTIELQLNPDGPVDKSIIVIINSLYRSTGAHSDGDIQAITKLLIAHSQWLLKDEWERVKYEAMGGTGKIISAIGRMRRKARYKRFLVSPNGDLTAINPASEERLR